MSANLSIVIPTYNRSNYLKTLISQLLSQSQPPHEIIIVDDHSTDNTARLVKTMAASSPRIKYTINQGHHQRDAKKTGLKYATGDYIGFFDDDAEIEDKELLAKLTPRLNPHCIIQTKVILEQMGRINRPDITWKDILATRPFPILELITSNFNCGTRQRTIFPLIEWGNFWHRSLKDYFIDNNLIKDAYGESYSVSLKLRQANIKLLLEPSLIIRHIGAPSGGSHKFHKKTMLQDFTEFHYGYFYNMIYLHSRFFPGWVWLWLPFYFTKSLVALAFNRNVKGWREYALTPIKESLRKHLPLASLKLGVNGKTPGVSPAGGPHKSIFIWQGHWQGGAERITLALAQYLATRGLNVTLGVYAKNPKIKLKQIVFPKFAPIPQSFRSLAASLIFRSRYSGHFHAVYAHTLGAWKTKNNKVFIHEAADLDTKLTQTNGATRKFAYLIWRRLYLKLSLKQAARIFAATPECAKFLMRHNIPPNRITASSSFYDETIFHYINRPLPTNPIKLIFIGNYRDPVKNFTALQRLFYSKQNYTMTVLGGPKIERDGNFIFRGYCSPHQVQQALAQADIFFMPSTSEGFSIALLEALATGIPCLANQSAHPAQLNNIRNFIPYATEREIPDKIHHITQNYNRLNVPDPLLACFAQSIVLHKEYKVIVDTLAKQTPAYKTPASAAGSSETHARK